MQASGSAMNPRWSVLWQPFTLGVFVILFGLSTAFLRSATCIEGGTVIGFPSYFYAQYYASMPGGPLDPAAFLPISLALDVVAWYLLSVGLVLLARRVREA